METIPTYSVAEGYAEACHIIDKRSVSVGVRQPVKSQPAPGN